MENSKLSSRFAKLNNKKNNNQASKNLKPEVEIVPVISEIPNNELEEDFKKSLLEKIDTTPVWFEYSKSRQKELVKNFVETKISAENIQLSGIDKDVFIDNLMNSITNFGVIQELLDNEKVSAVIVNGTKSIHIEIEGKILNTDTKLTEKQLKFLRSSIACMSGIETFKGINKFVIDKYSLTVAGEDICLSGINITIKKQKDIDSSFLINNGMMTKEIFDFLISAIDMKKNIVLSGDINSGKTTLLNVLIESALKNKRSFLLENNPQITTDFDTLVKLKNDNGVIPFILKSSPEVLISDLNYIEPEFIGTKGFISTLRANSPEAALQALIGMCVVSGLPEKFAKTKALTNFDYIVQIEKSEDGIRRIVSIIELTPAKTIQASIKSIAKYADGEYITQIPQPITSIRAKSILA